MATYILYSAIWHDGTGDCTHFEEIVKKLKADPRFNDVDFAGIVWFDSAGTQENYEKIQCRLQNLPIPCFLGKNDYHHAMASNPDPALKDYLSRADQVLVISWGAFFPYSNLLKSGVPIKAINEHERTEGLNPDWTTYVMGLNTRQSPQYTMCGIKISQYPHISVTEAWNIITQENPEIASQLLGCTQTENIDQLLNKCLLSHGYYNKPSDLLNYLAFMGIAPSLPEDKKDIVLYTSGVFFDESFRLLSSSKIPGTACTPEEIVQRFRNTEIDRIEIYSPGQEEPFTIKCASQGTRVVKLLSGYYLSKKSLDAFYALIKVAGVSGDNTLENCVSREVLPHYWSTNGGKKEATNYALARIAQLPEIAISQEARDSFRVFFTPGEYYLSNPATKPRYAKLNLPAMIEAWPQIVTYLRENKNFYDFLPYIVLTKLPNEALPNYFITQIINEALKEASRKTFPSAVLANIHEYNDTANRYALFSKKEALSAEAENAPSVPANVKPQQLSS